MKRFLVSVLLLTITYSSFSAIKTWIGAFGNNWNNAANWSPAGVPIAGDDIIINISGAILIDAASPIALNSIAVTSNSNVIFDCPDTKNFRLSSTSSITPGLLVQAGSSLTLDGSNPGTNNSSFNLTYGDGVIGSIYGTLIFSKTGGSPSNPGVHLITDNDPTNYGVVTVYSGGAIKIYPDAGNTASSLVPEPTFIMKDGALYESLKNGGSFPEGTWHSNSLAKANNATGINPPGFNGSVYGNLEWNCPNQQNFSLMNDITFNNVNLINTKGGASSFRITNTASATRTLTINGNLIISDNSKLEITGASVMTGGGRLILKGNLNNEGTITTNGISNTINDFELNGTSNQTITNAGTISGDKLLFIMNNPAGVTLNSPLELPGNLSLINGNIKTSSSNLLTMLDGTTVTGGSSSSFIEGPMKKIGDDEFVFPLGKGTMYAPLGIVGTSGSASDIFIAEYKRANPQSTSPYGPGVGANLDHVSYVEYWTLDASDGVGSKKISLGLHPLSFCKHISNTFIGYWNASALAWDSLDTNIFGTISSQGSYETGTLITRDPFDFGVFPARYTFSLVTDESFNNNPLPIDLISFRANKVNDKKAILNWELAACCSPGTKFEIERAGDDRRFKTIATIAGSDTDLFYSVIDHGLQTGINYYRLKMINIDGHIRYSRIEAIMNGIRGLYITSLFPNPASSKTIISIVSDTERLVELLIIDMQGHLVRKEQRRLNAGNNTITLLMDGLISGVYQVMGVSSEGKTNVMSLVKE